MAKKQPTKEELEARRKAYFENTVFIRVPKTQAHKFGVKVSEGDTTKDIANRIRDKFGIEGATRTGDSEMIGLMEEKIKNAGLKLPNKNAKTKEGKKINYYGRLRQLMAKVAIMELKQQQD